MYDVSNNTQIAAIVWLLHLDAKQHYQLCLLFASQAEMPALHRWTWLPAYTDSQVHTLILQIGLVMIVSHTRHTATHWH